MSLGSFLQQRPVAPGPCFPPASLCLGLGFAALLLPVPVGLDGGDLLGVSPHLEDVLLLLPLEVVKVGGRSAVMERVPRLGVENLQDRLEAVGMDLLLLDRHPLLLLLQLGEPQLLGEVLGALCPLEAVGGEAPVIVPADSVVTVGTVELRHHSEHVGLVLLHLGGRDLVDLGLRFVGAALQFAGVASLGVADCRDGPVDVRPPLQLGPVGGAGLGVGPGGLALLVGAGPGLPVLADEMQPALCRATSSTNSCSSDLMTAPQSSLQGESTTVSMLLAGRGILCTAESSLQAELNLPCSLPWALIRCPSSLLSFRCWE